MREDEERARNGEYLSFRREFDKLKQQHEGMHAESEKLKAQGNSFFSFGCYAQAAVLYSEAIDLQPDSAVLYCNRAMAYLKQEMPHEALADAEMSLQIDSAVTNIKAYWRQSQALLDLDRSVESEAAADAGLALQASNQHLNRVRRRAREVTALKRLSGAEWVTRLENGVEKRYSFTEDGTMNITVFGHSVQATFDLSVEGNPRSMVVRMSPEGLGGSGPPPPPAPYIFEFHSGTEDKDEELWLCQPVGSKELPTKFEGPGFDRMRRAPKTATVEEVLEPLDCRVASYMQEMNEALPLIPPQLPERPSEEEIEVEVQLMERVSQLKRRFGPEVHQRAVALAKDPELVGEPVLTELALELRRRLIARRLLAAPAAAPVSAVAAPSTAAPATTRLTDGGSSGDGGCTAAVAGAPPPLVEPADNKVLKTSEAAPVKPEEPNPPPQPAFASPSMAPAPAAPASAAGRAVQRSPPGACLGGLVALFCGVDR